MAGVDLVEHLRRVFDQCLQPPLYRVFLRTVLMVGERKRHQVAVLGDKW